MPRPAGASRPWRASEFLRAAPRTLYVPIPVLTRDPRAFSHLTHPQDAREPAARGKLGRAGPTLLAEGSPQRAFRTAVRALRNGKGTLAANAFAREARWYESAGLWLLALHARQDEELARGTVNRRGRLPVRR